MNHNLLVGQSGGPTAVINGSLYGVVSEGLANPEIDNVIGMVNGIEGFLADHTIDMAPLKENGELERIRTTPGSYLGSCRYKLPENLSDPVYPELFQKFTEKEISYFFYIGGNDSMDTVSKLSRYAATVGSDIRIIGVPKTIDNDLVLTDHTPGYGSAAKYVASTVREIAIDASVYDNKPSVTIVEIMGRHAGWLTAASVLARKFEGDNPVLIYLPEVAFSPDAFIEKVKEKLTKTSNLVVVKVRSVELNVCQRCSSSCLSATDLDEAAASGRFAVSAALDGETGKMINFIRKSDDPYILEFGTADVNEICNKEKAVPEEWITKDGSDIGDEFIAYARPLIQGSVEVPMKDGLPYFAFRK